MGEVAAALGVTARTVRKWREGYAAEGEAGLRDRSSRPHASPTRLGDRARRAQAKCRGLPRARAGLVCRPGCHRRAGHDRQSAAARSIRRRVRRTRGSAYVNHAFRQACEDADLKHKRTRPHTPRTNGKADPSPGLRGLRLAPAPAPGTGTCSSRSQAGLRVALAGGRIACPRLGRKPGSRGAVADIYLHETPGNTRPAAMSLSSRAFDAAPLAR